MKKITVTAFFVFYLFVAATSVLALIITKNETRDVVGSYGAINTDSPYFPHTRIPHPNSGTSDGRIKTTDVDIYPGTGMGNFFPVKTVTLGMHDHDDNTVVAIWVHTTGETWVQLVAEYDIATIGGDNLCGEDSTMYGLNRHPHNDGSCYVNHTFQINMMTDALLLKFSCAQISSGCPRNDDVHNHISNIVWDIEDPATPTVPATATPVITATPTPSATRTPTPTATSTLTPTATIAPLTATPTLVPLKACNNLSGCNSGAECQSGFCYAEPSGLRFCRNVNCPTDTNCSCGGGPTPTTAPMGTAFCPI